MTNVPEPVAKRADRLVVGDRIPDEHLAFRFNQGPAEVVFVAHEAARERDPLPWVFVAYQYPNGRHDSMTIRPEAELQVYPAPAPQPLAGGLVEVDPPEGFVPARAPVRGISPDRVPLCSHGDDADACQLFHPPLDQDAADAAAFDRGWMAEHRRVAKTRPDHPLSES